MQQLRAFRCRAFGDHFRPGAVAQESGTNGSYREEQSADALLAMKSHPASSDDDDGFASNWMRMLPASWLCMENSAGGTYPRVLCGRCGSSSW
jgi:hypothetical protein